MVSDAICQLLARPFAEGKSTRAVHPGGTGATSFRLLVASFKVNGQDTTSRLESEDSLRFGDVVLYLPASKHAGDPTDGALACWALA